MFFCPSWFSLTAAQALVHTNPQPESNTRLIKGMPRGLHESDCCGKTHHTGQYNQMDANSANDMVN
jgi:hypothetical protein